MGSMETISRVVTRLARLVRRVAGGAFWSGGGARKSKLDLAQRMSAQSSLGVRFSLLVSRCSVGVIDLVGFAIPFCFFLHSVGASCLRSAILHLCL